jgi:NADPH-dependent 2,4-dienoyl-CoA reductase/sulfur reductase-like enzyme
VSRLVRQGSRLAPGSVAFRFDGRDYLGQRGDSAASALLANGQRLLGRSAKYRRLRGLLAAGPEEPNGLLTVGNPPALIPNVSAPSLVLREGLELRSQNRWPTLRFDVASLLQAGGGFLGAGFYYKTFMWPSWRFYEPIIRRLAGLGAAPGESVLPAVAIEHLSCDVLVAGGGAAGLAAALSAARAGARVVLCEREPVLGGELEFETAIIATRPAPEWVATTCAELIERGARILTDTALVGGSDGQLIAHAEPGGLPGANTLYRIRPSAAVLAMGAIERLIAFVDNDRPGVMLLGAAERVKRRCCSAVTIVCMPRRAGSWPGDCPSAPSSMCAPKRNSPEPGSPPRCVRSSCARVSSACWAIPCRPPRADPRSPVPASCRSPAQVPPRRSSAISCS